MYRMCALAMLLVFAGSGTLSAYFEDLGRDARARGIANAMVSVYGGVHSIHYNPAGTLRTGNIELNLEWGNPFTMGELNDGTSFNQIYVGLIVPFGNMVAGLSFDQQDKAQLVTERLITLNYGMALDRLLKGAKISAGINLDLYMLEFVVNDDFATLPDNPKSNIMAFGIDLGVIYHFSDAIRIGAVFENLLPPNFSVFEGGSDPAPTNIKLGGSIFFKKLAFMENMTVMLNYVSYGKYDPDDNTVAKTSWHGGFESWFANNMIGIRSGVTLGDDEQNEIATGISFQLVMGGHVIAIDYAFTISLGVQTYRHLVGLTWKWQQGGMSSAARDELNRRKRR